MALGRAQHAEHGTREAGDDRTVERCDSATTLVSLGDAQHAASSSREAGDDVVDVGAPNGGAVVVPATVHRALPTAEGSDACAVDMRTNAHAGFGERAGNEGQDTAVPHRASFDRVVAPTANAGGGAITAAACVDIGEDRPPTVETAAWHFPVAHGVAKATPHRPQQPATKGSSGTQFLSDRLSQPHAQDWRQYNRRVHPGGPCDESAAATERHTPVPFHPRGEPPLQQLATGGAHLGVTTHSGRSTPMTRSLQPSPMTLR